MAKVNFLDSIHSDKVTVHLNNCSQVIEPVETFLTKVSANHQWKALEALYQFVKTWIWGLTRMSAVFVM